MPTNPTWDDVVDDEKNTATSASAPTWDDVVDDEKAPEADQQDWQNTPNLSPLEVAGYAGADALRRAAMVVNPAVKAAGLAGTAIRSGVAAGMSGVDRALENYSADRPITEGVGTAMGIGGGLNAGIEAAIAPAIKAGALVYKGGKWIKNQAAEAMFDNKLTKEMLDSQFVQDTINKIASVKGAFGFGKNLEGRVADVADEAKGAYASAVGDISDEAIPISKVLPDDVLQNLDVGPLDNSVRSQLPNYKKKIVENLEPVALKNDRLAKSQAIRDTIVEKKGATLAEKQKLLEKLSKVEDDFSQPLEQAMNADKALKTHIAEVEAANKMGAKAKPVTSLQDDLASEAAGRQADIAGELKTRADEIEQYKQLYPSTAEVQKPIAKPLSESDELLRRNLDTLNKEIDTLATKTGGQKSGRDSTELGKLRARRDELTRYLSKKKIPAQVAPDIKPDPMVDKVRTLQDEYALQENLAGRESARLQSDFESSLPMAQQLDSEASQFVPQPIPEFTSAVPAVKGQIANAKAGINNDISNLTRSSAEEIGALSEAANAVPRQTTLREAYNVANTPMKGEINPLTDTLGTNVRQLGGESVALADKAKGDMETLETLSDAAVRQDGSLKSAANNILRWGGRAAAVTHPMAWATAEIASNPELRYVIGSGLEKLGKWSPKLQEAYTAGGAKAVNVLVNTLNQTDPEFRQAHAGNQQVSPYQEGAEKQRIKKPELSRQDFLKNLGGVESAGKYDATNPKSSATGKYQFLWNTWGDDVSKWAGAPISQKMFLKNPKLQELYMKYHHDTILSEGAKTLRSRSPNAANRSDTELKALIHFKGLGGARKYLDTGADDTSANNIHVEDYIKRVGGGA